MMGQSQKKNYIFYKKSSRNIINIILCIPKHKYIIKRVKYSHVKILKTELKFYNNLLAVREVK